MIRFVIFLVIWIIYRHWFTDLILSSGDWPYLYLENIQEFSWWPQANYLWLAPYYQIFTKITVQYLGIPWIITEKILWFLPFILLSLLSSYKLTKSLFGALIYTTNTYVLMIVGGGQLGIAMAYAIAPLVLNRFINHTNFVLNGIIFSIQMMFDPRISYLTLSIVVFYYLFHNRISELFRNLVFSIALAVLLNFYWLIPFFSSELPISQQIGDATIESARFLSFAKFEQTISLLHPNWPENIFGKVYFMQPEFLLIPILAFTALIFRPYNRKIIFFSLLGLLGAFLGKGTNPPFGEIYSWFFTYVPGFSLFRDPTKFYLFTAISFSVLIPFSISKLEKRKIISILFILFWVFTIREAIFGQLTGTFKPINIPTEYIKLKDYLVADSQAFQTLWIPERQRFGFASRLHPSIDAKLLSGESSISGILTWIDQPSRQREFNLKNIKYIIVPFDVRGELFLTDRKYDERIYFETLGHLTTLSWLKRLSVFNQIGVFEIK